MRERGAKVTDIIVLVVSVDDGIMAQTAESIGFAKANNVPLVVAFNKCDKYGLDRLDKLKDDLARHEVYCEDLGGETQSVPVSGLTGLNMDKLLEAIVAQGELMELRADPTAPVKATIVESRIKVGLGDCATVLVQQGTLKPGMILSAEDAYCKVRLMTDCSGNTISEAPPSSPVEVSGWKSVPKVGAAVFQHDSDVDCRDAIDSYLAQAETMERRRLQKLAKERETLHDRMWEYIEARKRDPTLTPLNVMSYEKFQDSIDPRPVLPVIVKCDVVGSQDAVTKVLTDIKSKKVRLDIVSVGVGAVTESDVKAALAARASILTFNLKTPRAIMKVAQADKVSISDFNIIYRLAEHVEASLAALLPQELGEKIVGKASILQVFNIDGAAPVAGCRVEDGNIYRSSERLPDSKKDKYTVKLMRADKVIWEGRIETMKHLKRDIPSANKGLECGIVLADCSIPFQTGDVLVCFENFPLPAKL